MRPRAYLSSLRAVLGGYTPEKRHEDRQAGPVVTHVYRPVSFAVTPLFLAANVTANQATALGIVAALAMPLAARFLAHGAAWVAFLAFFYHVMDHVDGNIARATRRSTYGGAVLERLHAIPFWPFFLASVGILVDGSGGWLAGYGLVIGLSLACLLLVKRQIHEVFEQAYDEREVSWGPPAADEETSVRLSHLGYVIEHAYATVLLCAAGEMGLLDPYLLGISAYLVGVFASWIPKLVSTARRHEREVPVARR